MDTPTTSRSSCSSPGSSAGSRSASMDGIRTTGRSSPTPVRPAATERHRLTEHRRRRGAANGKKGVQMVAVTAPVGSSGIARSPRRVIIASSLGTVFEWYDFFLYGSLAAVISKQFFAGVSETTGFMFALLTWAAGFAVRPLGALVFGRLGDLVGRKRTFL